MLKLLGITSGKTFQKKTKLSATWKCRMENMEAKAVGIYFEHTNAECSGWCYFIFFPKNTFLMT